MIGEFNGPFLGAGPGGTMSEQFRVLMVCTANHCRSPLAERMLVRELQDREPAGPIWTVRSAGTDGLVDRPMHPYAEQVLAERGIDGSDFRGRDLTEAIARDADLILTATREHRTQVLRVSPAVLSRTFTLKQFARLAAAVPERPGVDAAARGHELVRQARFARSLVTPATGDLDDLDDPIGHPVQDYRRCADELTDAIAAILGPR